MEPCGEGGSYAKDGISTAIGLRFLVFNLHRPVYLSLKKKVGRESVVSISMTLVRFMSSSLV